MFSGIITTEALDERNQLCICKWNGRAASQRAVQGHLQSIGHVLNDFTVGQIELGIAYRSVDAKGFQNHRIVEG